MKRIVIVTVLIITLASIAAGQAKGKRPVRRQPSASADQALKDLKRQLMEGFKNQDREVLNRILADDFIFTDEDGRAFNKAQYVEAAGTVKLESYTLDDVTTRVYGDTCIVAGRRKGKFTSKGKTSGGDYRFTDTFVKRPGGWRIVASQDTRIKGIAMGGEITTESGLKYVDEIVGMGESPKPGQRVAVHYTGTLENGQKFDSSLDRGQPFVFQIGMGRVIKGWDEGVMTMKVGGKRRLIIPPDLGYGARGAGGVIPPNATLIFEVELLGVQ